MTTYTASCSPQASIREFPGRSTFYLLLDEYSFSADPVHDFSSPADLFNTISLHFNGEWISESSIGYAEVECIVSQRFDSAHEWWHDDCEDAAKLRIAQGPGRWAAALNLAANANLLRKIATDRLCDPLFIAQTRADWQRDVLAAAADFPSPRVDWPMIGIPMMMLAALEDDAAPGFMFADATFADFAYKSFDWRSKIAWAQGMELPEGDGHWIVVTLRKRPWNVTNGELMEEPD